MFEKQKEILDKAFSENVPGWETLSPLDPMKTIAESLSSALEAIEIEQTRQLETVLDAIPNMIGFTQRAATPSKAIFRVIPAKTAVSKQDLPPGTEFLMNGGDTYAVLREKMQVYPATLVKEDRAPKSMVFEFSVRGELPELKLLYTAPPSAKKTPLLDLKLEIKSGASSSTAPLFLDDLLYLDETFAGTATGHVILRPLSGQSAVLCGANSTVRLELVFENEVPRGAFHFNGCSFDLVAVSSGSELGSLAGEAWEECALADTVLQAPQSVDLVLADGSSTRFDLLAIDPLKARAHGADAFKNRFLYSAARHSLVFPTAHALKGSLNGRIQIYAHRLVQLSENTALGKGTLHTDAPMAIERIEPSGVAFPAVARETKEAYLARFHAWVRNSLLLPSTTGAAYLTELSQSVMGLDSRIRAVEINADTTAKVLTFYILYHGQSEGSVIAAPPADLLSKLSDRIGRLCPLDYRWQIERFSETRIEVQASLKTVVADGAPLIPEAELEKVLETAVQKALQHETFALGIVVGREALVERIQRRIAHPQLSGDLQIQVGMKTIPEGVSLSSLSRNLGTAYRFSVQHKATQTVSEAQSVSYQEEVAR